LTNANSTGHVPRKPHAQTYQATILASAWMAGRVTASRASTSTNALTRRAAIMPRAPTPLGLTLANAIWAFLAMESHVQTLMNVPRLFARPITSAATRSGPIHVHVSQGTCLLAQYAKILTSALARAHAIRRQLVPIQRYVLRTVPYPRSSFLVVIRTLADYVFTI
jgi:hypothetical protein